MQGPHNSNNPTQYRPAIEWDIPLRHTDDNDPHYLLGSVTVGGVHFHAEAWEATYEDDDGLAVQTLLGDHAESGDAILDRVVNGAGQTIIIEGKEYVFAITPFER